MSPVFIQSIGITAPGLPDWETAAAVLSGARDYRPTTIPRLSASMLPANERRRTTGLIRIALESAQQAFEQTSLPKHDIHSVFASSEGDMEVVDKLCSTLARDPSLLSPTLFHNSVHNAPAGYWAIGSGTTGPSTSLSADNATFCAGLMEAWTQLQTGAKSVLLVAYDHPGPEPLASHRPLVAPFACAILFTSTPTDRSLASVHLEPRGEMTEDRMTVPGLTDLEALRIGNPAARSLPVLRALSLEKESRVALACLPGTSLSLHIRTG